MLFNTQQSVRQIYISLLGLRRFAKFIIVGGTAGAVGYATLWLLADLFGIHYLISSAGAFVVCVPTGYLGNWLWTFRSKRKLAYKQASYAMYLALHGSNLVAIEAITALLVEVLGLHYMLSVLAAALALAPINYVVCRRWVFKRQPS